MKESLQLLPTEVWVDIFRFPWKSREEFGKIVHRFRNKKFVEFAQFYLHEWGKRSLGRLFFQRGLFRVNNALYRVYLDVPRIPVSECPNIKKFGNIKISHFDAETIAFLGQIRSLLTGVYLVLFVSPKDLANLRSILTRLAPLLVDVHALECNECALPVLRQSFGEHLAQLKMLKVTPFITGLSRESIDFVLNWLIQPRNAGPRMCELSLSCDNDRALFEHITRAVRQQFLAATAPRTFALNFIAIIGEEDGKFAEFHLVNGIGEQLHGKWDVPKKGPKKFQITRHRANCNAEMVREWNETTTSEKRIEIYYPTFDPFDAVAQMGLPCVRSIWQQQPSTSKDA